MISVHELTKRFEDGGREIVAVSEVSFRVEPAEVYGLLGPNGAGKTTTLRMLLGLLQPTAGYAAIDDFRSDVSAEEVKARVGLVSSGDGIYQWLTPREMLLFFADLYGVPQSEAVENLARLADLLGLHAFLDQRGGTLSTGQRQRINLARALIHDPPVMLLDEPTRGLDVIATQVVFDFIHHLRDRGKAVILSTHRLDEAQRVCDRFGLLHEGRLVQEGTLEELRAASGYETLAEMFLHFAESESSEETPVSWK